jgi:tRNA (guanine26-N2/guanine27-N2)-dimethyltransferase
MSIAILRTFVAKRKEEHEEMINKKNKSYQHVSQDIPPTSDGDGTSSEQLASSSLDGETNGNHGKEIHRTADKAEGPSTETTQTPSSKRIKELNAPIVLEVGPYYVKSLCAGLQYE